METLTGRLTPDKSGYRTSGAAEGALAAHYPEGTGSFQSSRRFRCRKQQTAHCAETNGYLRRCRFR